MDPLQSNNMLEQLLKVTEENNHLLKKMHKNQVIQSWVRMGYWIIILGISYGGYLALKPTFSSLLDTYSKVMPAQSGLINTLDQETINSLLKQFGQ